MRALLILAGLLAFAAISQGAVATAAHEGTGMMNRKMLGEAAPQQVAEPANQVAPAAAAPQQTGTAQPESSQQPATPDSTTSAPVTQTEGIPMQAAGAAVAVPQSDGAQPASANQWGGGWQDWRYDSWRNRGRWRPPGDSAWGWPGDSDWGNWLKTQGQAVTGDVAAVQAVTGGAPAAPAVGGAAEVANAQKPVAEPAAPGPSP